MSDHHTTNIESSSVAADGSYYTEQKARDHLVKINGKRPPVRELAKLFGWSTATTGRFTQAFDAETRDETAVRQSACPKPPAPEEENFDWSSTNPDLIVPHQPALAIYANPYGQIIIRSENTDFGSCEEDRFIQISPHHLSAVISKLQAVAIEIGADK